MNDTRAHDESGRAGSPADRLLLDLLALGRLDPERPTAAERLDAELGPDLAAAVAGELERLDVDEQPLGDWRVA